MPRFVNETHRRRWIASQKRSWARRRDTLKSGGELGKRDEFVRAKETYEHKHAKALNGNLDSVLQALRAERVKANDRVTQLDRAIDALNVVKPAAVQ